ncbi:MAG TPA: hypothetical protein VE170_10290 [Candidatus Limnocylindria bacterium]|nr:hypothetical protein [Candidatus Limnocylindria bacterium]
MTNFFSVPRCPVAKERLTADWRVHERRRLAAQNKKSAFFHDRFEQHVGKRGIDPAAHQRADPFYRAAAHLQRCEILGRIGTGVLQQHLDNQPGFTTGAIDADFFAAQVADVGDFFPRHPDIGHQIIPAAQRDHIRALRMARQQAGWIHDKFLRKIIGQFN